MKKLQIIAGNCILEDIATSVQTVEFLKAMSEEYNFELIYKSSFKKDNRSDIDYYTGLSIWNAISMFKVIKSHDVTLITDFHNLYELETEIVNVVDILQVPAYLSMQTELLSTMASKGKPINIKKGQFLAPRDMRYAIRKVENQNNFQIMITERGTSFGYHDLIADPRSIYELKKFGYPVFFDAGHCVRKYGIPSSSPSGGAKEYIPTLSKAMIASGADGIFVECHPSPEYAKCDAATQLTFDEFENLMKELVPIWRAIHG